MPNQEISQRFLEVIPGVMSVLRSEIRAEARAQFTIVQFRVLAHLHHQGSMTNRDLADAIGLSVAAMSRLVQGLVTQGLVSRREDARDRRRADLALTSEGSKAYARLRSAAAKRIARKLEAVDAAQKARLLAGLEVIESAFAGMRKKPTS